MTLGRAGGTISEIGISVSMLASSGGPDRSVGAFFFCNDGFIVLGTKGLMQRELGREQNL